MAITVWVPIVMANGDVVIIREWDVKASVMDPTTASAPFGDSEIMAPDAVIVPPDVSVWEPMTYWFRELAVIRCEFSVRAGGTSMADGMGEVVWI